MGCHIFHKSAKSISQEETDRDTSRIRCQSQNVERFVRAYHNAADICGLAVFHTNQDIIQFLIACSDQYTTVVSPITLAWVLSARRKFKAVP